MNFFRECYRTFRRRQSIRIDLREAASRGASAYEEGAPQSDGAIQSATADVAQLRSLLATQQYHIPSVLFPLVALVTALFLVVGWTVDYPWRTAFSAKLVTSHVSLTLLDSYSLTDGIAIVDEHLEMVSDGTLAVTSPNNQDMIEAEIMSVSFADDDASRERERGNVNRLDIPALANVSFGHRNGYLELDVRDGTLEAIVTANDDFVLTTDTTDGVAEIVYEGMADRSPRRRPRFRLRSNASAQIDFEPDWNDVEFITMRASNVLFSRISDSEENRRDCFVQSGSVRMPKTDDEEAIFRGECLSLSEFDGTVTIEGSEEGFVVHLLGEADKIGIGSEHYQRSVTPSLLAVVMSYRFAQAIVALFTSIVVSLLAVHFEGRGQR